MDDDVIFFEHIPASNPQQKRQIESIKDSSLSALLTESRVESPANVMHEDPIASLHQVNDFPETSLVSADETDELESWGEPRYTYRWPTFCGRLSTFFFGLSKETEPINPFPSIQQRPLWILDYRLLIS